ncbi:tetratricopeptide repeat protein [Candidatus Methylacidiphilum infernorum]|nr:tetratricopeptide repeat protein [Candidatus Methylacidiphilum infernorum]
MQQARQLLWLFSLLLIFGLSPQVFAVISPQDEFLNIYLALQEAEQMEKKGEAAGAFQKYSECCRRLELLKKNFPEWEPGIVNFRINYSKEKLKVLGPKLGKTPEEVQKGLSSALSSTRTEPPTLESNRDVIKSLLSKHNKGSSSEEEVTKLKYRISQLESELAQTKMKLEEAVTEANMLRNRLAATQRELAMFRSSNIESKITAVLQENNSLKAKLAQAEAKIRTLQAGNSEAGIAALRDQLKGVQEQLTILERENEVFRNTASTLKSQLEIAQQKLAESARELATAPNTESLRKENEILRGIINRQLQEQARRDSAKRLVLEELQNLKIDSKFLQKELEFLSSPVVNLSPEEMALLKSPSQPGLGEIQQSSFEAQLTKPQEEQQHALGQSNTTPQAESKGETTADHVQSNPALPSADAQPVAYQSSHEGSAVPADPKAQTAASAAAANESAASTLPAALPDDVQKLVDEASTLFSGQHYQEAAEKYRQILEKFPNSVTAWANLGVIYYQQGQLKEAENALAQALKLNPNDAFSHSILGIVYYQEGLFDNAVTELTRAIVINPNDPKTRNYLGIACSKKGWQEAAEKELRKALELDPNYGDAHFNLAVIYATQRPPAKELAKRHYQDALSLGIPKDPGLEKFLE